MTEIIVESVINETVIEIEDGPTLTTVTDGVVETIIQEYAEPVLIDLNSGPRGEPGAAILVGPYPPDPMVGVMGDMYIVTQGSTLVGQTYRKTSAEVWTDVGNVRGPAGGVNTVNTKTGPDVVLTKADIGLGNVDNTTDASKPVSTATQTALNAKQDGLTKGTIAVGTDMNTFVTNGNWRVAMTSGEAATTPNFPAGAYPYGQLVVDVSIATNVIVQTYTPHAIQNAAASYVRMMWSGTWTTWRTGADLNNLTKTHVGLANVTNVAQVDLTSNQTVTGYKSFTGGIAVDSGELRVGTTATVGHSLVAVNSNGMAAYANPSIITTHTTVKNAADNTSTYPMGLYIQSSSEGTDWPNPLGVVVTALTNVERGIQINAGKGNNVFRWRAAEVASTNGWRPWNVLADDSLVVHNTGNETVAGTKTFSSPPIVPTPTIGTHAANADYVNTRLNAVIDAAPGTLDTLNELAAALGDDPNFATTISNSIAATNATVATKAPINNPTFTGTVGGITKAMVGLSNVPNVDSQNATNLTSGTVADARLPTRLGIYAKTITDWNLATENGWYMGSNILNAPTAGTWYIGEVVVHNPQWVTQTVYNFTAAGHKTGADLAMYRRQSSLVNSATDWGPWYRVRISEAEQDARYAMLTGTQTIAGSKTFSSPMVITGPVSGAGSQQALSLAASAVGSSTPGTINNVKLLLYTSGYGFGVSASRLEYQSPAATYQTFYIGGTSRLEISQSGITVGGSVTASSFSGSGANLTALNGSQVTSGTIAAERLATSVVHRVVHNGTAYPTRPAVTYVEWVGPTTPTGATANDTWVNTAG